MSKILHTKASKPWQCSCGCEETIKPGGKIIIETGCIYNPDHYTPEVAEKVECKKMAYKQNYNFKFTGSLKAAFF